jgi:glyoxylase-like metal-dependent hydrolase (beta-lactamase superfamily II)
MLDKLTMFEPAEVTSEVFALPAWCPVPGLGVLAINAFVVRGRCPVLIDTGTGPLKDEFLKSLGSVIDPADLRYIWLTHADPDHTGAIEPLMALAPQARVVTTFVGAAKLSFYRNVPPDRLHLINLGERLMAGDRELVAMRPPAYDAPETIAAFDRTTRTLFSADTFGALLPAPAPTAAAASPAAVREGVLAWAAVDTPWLGSVNQTKFEATLESFRRLDAQIVLSGHLPPATGMMDALLGHLAAAPSACDATAPEDPAAAAIKAA